MSRRDRLIANYGLWVISVLLVVLAMAIVGGRPHPHRPGNGLPAGVPIQQGRVVIGETPVDAFSEGAALDTSQVGAG